MGQYLVTKNRSVAALLVALALLPAAGGAQTNEGGESRWLAHVTVKSGVFAPRASADLYEFLTQRLTLERSDFRGGAFGVEVDVWTRDRAVVVAGVEMSNASEESVYRNKTHTDGSPIEQTTQLQLRPALYVGGKVYLKPPLGPSAGSGPFNGFVGAGGGRLSYHLHQTGEFYDERLDVVFEDDFVSEAGSTFAYLSGGATARLLNGHLLVLEGGYRWGKAPLGPEFRGFGPLDLSGFSLSLGASISR